MELIDRAAAVNYLMLNMGWHDEDGREVDDACEKRPIIEGLIGGIPTIEAVPLDKLCEWLANLFGCPCDFSPIDEEMFEHCKEDCVNDDIECWKRVLKQFMEGQHEKEKG